MVRVRMEAPDPSSMRGLDASLLPPAVGNNWKDTAFKGTHGKAQLLHGEFAGTRSSGRRGQPAPLANTLLTDQSLPGVGTSRRDKMPEVTSQSALDLARTLHVSALRNTRGAVEEIPMEEKETITLDDKVLKFYAYLEEAVRESASESSRVRKVTIHYFPADETITITEARVANSGLQGGLLLKRGKVPITVRQREKTPDDEYLNLNHINVGERDRKSVV